MNENLDRTMRRTFGLAACGLLALASACGGEEANGPGPNGEAANVPGLDDFYLATPDGLDHGVLSSLSLSPDSMELERSLTQMVTLSGTFADGTTIDLDEVAQVSWSSSDESIFTVGDASADGVEVTAVEIGTAKLIATLGSLSAEEDVSVIAPSLVSITIEETTVANLKATGALTATGVYVDQSTQDLTKMVTWSSSAPDILVVLDDTARKGLTYGRARGSATITATFEGISATADLAVPCALNPGNALIKSGIMPNASWDGAVTYDSAGNREVKSISMETLMCDPAYDNYRAFVLTLNAAWCGPCHALIRSMAQYSADLEAAGILPMTVVGDSSSSSSNPNYSGATSVFADAMVSETVQSVGASPSFTSIRVGDAETGNVDANGNYDGIKRVFVDNAADRLGWPTRITVRRSDMEIVSIDSGGFSGTVQPMINVVNDNIDPVVSGTTNCAATDEESFEPNDAPGIAPEVGFGTYTGGICDASADYYLVKVDGPWEATLQFENYRGDLDLYAWDTTSNSVLVQNGESKSSVASASNFETLQLEGTVVLRVQAKIAGNTNPYTLFVQPR